MTRHRPSLIVLTIFATGALTMAVNPSSELAAPAQAKRDAPVVFRGNGIGRSAFGQREATAIARLRLVLGAPKSTHPLGMDGNCTIDAAMDWPTVTAYFLHGVFVGYATGSLLGGPDNRKLPDGATAAGLHIGDTLSRAAGLYRGFLRTSYAQGGSWFAETASGTLAGYLTSEVNSTNPLPRIADITAGSVGCPAASP